MGYRETLLRVSGIQRCVRARARWGWCWQRAGSSEQAGDEKAPEMGGSGANSNAYEKMRAKPYLVHTRTFLNCVWPNSMLTPLEPQSRFGDKPVKTQVVCPQNGAAVPKSGLFS